MKKYAIYFILYADSVMQGENCVWIHSNTRIALLSSRMHEFVALHTVTIEFILPDRLAKHIDCIKFSEWNGFVSFFIQSNVTESLKSLALELLQ